MVVYGNLEPVFVETATSGAGPCFPTTAEHYTYVVKAYVS